MARETIRKDWKFGGCAEIELTVIDGLEVSRFTNFIKVFRFFEKISSLLSRFFSSFFFQKLKFSFSFVWNCQWRIEVSQWSPIWLRNFSKSKEDVLLFFFPFFFIPRKVITTISFDSRTSYNDGRIKKCCDVQEITFHHLLHQASFLYFPRI